MLLLLQVPREPEPLATPRPPFNCRSGEPLPVLAGSPVGPPRSKAAHDGLASCKKRKGGGGGGQRWQEDVELYEWDDEDEDDMAALHLGPVQPLDG